jgi:hypothetical protein
MVGSESLFLLVKSTAIILGIISSFFDKTVSPTRISNFSDHQHYAMKHALPLFQPVALLLATGVIVPVLPTW